MKSGPLQKSKMEVNELLDEIRKLDVVLPEFQREFVWDPKSY